MDTLESISLSDVELASIKDNLLLTVCTLRLDYEDLNAQLLIRTLDNLFLVINDRLDELNGYKLEVSSLHNAFTSSRERFNSSINDHLHFEELWSEEKRSLQDEISNFKKKIRVLESKIITQAAIIDDAGKSSTSNVFIPQTAHSQGVNINPIERPDAAEMSGKLSNTASGVVDLAVINQPPLSCPESDVDEEQEDNVIDHNENINELKREIITLRIKLQKVKSIHEDACGAWMVNREAIIQQETELFSKLEESKNLQMELAIRNEHLQSELASARLELEESRLIPPVHDLEIGTLSGTSLSKELLVDVTTIEFFSKLTENAHVIDVLNKKCHEMDSVISDLKKNVINITKSLSYSTNSRSSTVTQKKPAPKIVTREPNVILLGDSYLYGMREELASVLPGKYTSTAIRMTDATLPALIKSWSNLNSQPDFLVLSAGSVDVAYNELKSFKHELLRFCQTLNGTRLIILAAPFNYSLPPLSCVNLEIHRLNKFLSSLPFKFSSVQLIEMSNIDRSSIASKGVDPYYTVSARQNLCHWIRKIITTPVCSDTVLSLGGGNAAKSS